ncbi:hypothetical protein PT974_05695 [Cladobotryum mycophilum]|uniref:Phosphoglycerate mutase family protein n=1 Tax=Cladobotryum mycophilum TaxID=491253 RepID=A0ABR0SJF8_9HYPO
MVAAKHPSVYLIRHGEKPMDKKDHGLSPKGRKRAECLRSVFNEDSHYDIGYIMVEKKKTRARVRPFETVLPLAKDLGIEIDDSCDQLDAHCVKKAINRYKGPGNILICWEHKGLDKIVKKLGVKGRHHYPLKSYDLIWSIHSPYSKIASMQSENCPGLDRAPHHADEQLEEDELTEEEPLDDELWEGDELLDELQEEL